MRHSADIFDAVYNANDVVNARLSTRCGCEGKKEEEKEDKDAIAAGLNGKIRRGRRRDSF